MARLKADRKIVVVTDGHYDPSVDSFGHEVVVSPAVFTNEERIFGAKKLGILRAMKAAVKVAVPGDLIIQNDVELLSDPFGHPTLEKSIRTLVPPVGGGTHFCPQAFIIPSEKARYDLLNYWGAESVNACAGWRDLPKTFNIVGAKHRGGING